MQAVAEEIEVGRRGVWVLTLLFRCLPIKGSIAYHKRAVDGGTERLVNIYSALCRTTNPPDVVAWCRCGAPRIAGVHDVLSSWRTTVQKNYYRTYTVQVVVD